VFERADLGHEIKQTLDLRKIPCVNHFCRGHPARGHASRVMRLTITAVQRGEVCQDGSVAANPRLRDVAILAKVDPSVVSRVLSGDPSLSIRPSTRMRVLDAVEHLGYRRNVAAASLKMARTMAIGMVIPDLANLNYALIAEGAERQAIAAGYSPLIIAGGSADGRVASLRGRVDGLLVGMATSDAPRGNEFRDFPAILVNRKEPWGIPSVTVNDAAGAKMGTEYLLNLGHVRIGHIAGPQNADPARRRHQGYLEALSGRGIEPQSHWVAETSFDEFGGHSAALELLSQDARLRPTALFVSNVRAALGAMSAARELGIHIPDDLSVVALHDLPFVAYLDPPLTTVKMPLVELGRRAADNLIKVLSGRSVEDVQIATAPELVVRSSARSPHRGVS
jgi:LacI family transcriptional regulator